MKEYVHLLPRKEVIWKIKYKHKTMIYQNMIYNNPDAYF